MGAQVFAREGVEKDAAQPRQIENEAVLRITRDQRGEHPNDPRVGVSAMLVKLLSGRNVGAHPAPAR